MSDRPRDSAGRRSHKVEATPDRSIRGTSD